MRWGFALRIAARDALRHKLRSLLVLTMIALPVLVVSAAITLVVTSQVSGQERIERKMGAAEALVWSEYRKPVDQAPDPFDWERWPVGDRLAEAPDLTDVAAVLGPDAHFVERRTERVEVRDSDKRLISFTADEVDLTHPITRGLFELTQGRLPAGAHEVVVSEPSVEAGFAIGARIEIPGVEEPAVVVGVGNDATTYDGLKVFGPIGSLIADTGPRNTGASDEAPQVWLVEGVEVTWSDVQELNERGFFVGSRAVIEDPPFASAASWVQDATGGGGDQAETLTVVLLVIVMALLEVALLAGPAFAVNARSQARTLALVAMAGGTPRQARRVILAAGLVLGTLATALGLVLGVATARVFQPLVQRFNGEWFGPFEVPWGWLVPVAVFGLLSALAAAVVPAWLASRQDPVAVMAGRRADAAPDPRTPVLGLVLLLIGVAGAWFGTQGDYTSAVPVAASAVAAMVGMILVAPVLVTTVARLARPLPLPVRYAARDASRHRGRTVPAVAAVAATVAGVVAIGIAVASDDKEYVETYIYAHAVGDGQIIWSPEEEGRDAEAGLIALAEVAGKAAPEVEVTPMLSPDLGEAEREGDYVYWEVDHDVEGNDLGPMSHGGGGASSIGIAPDTSHVYLSEDVRERADEALAAGRAVVFTDQVEGERDVVLSRVVERDYEDEVARTPDLEVALPALLVRTEGVASVIAMLPEELARDRGLEPIVTGVHLSGVADEETQQLITKALQQIDPTAEAWIERGPRSQEWQTVLLVVAVAGAVLMLAGTLTATFLALSDARPDLATLSAVGGAPRTRRAVAGSYALLVGATGAVLGAAVGFVPGLGMASALTRGDLYSGNSGPYIDIPWLLIVSIVVLLPLLTAAIVWVSARSRLPLVTRIE
ncbi:ABC transporter permease [Nocardioides gilvus]|uniref:ABC transporter permease n=1 Tax=Nocardioides gilvus TaxID=1735589 RepID=UPI000D74D5E7|nr:ABC transporter permease [Nocardioides gilvus]